jgi:hypothetical protein
MNTSLQLHIPTNTVTSRRTTCAFNTKLNNSTTTSDPTESWRPLSQLQSSLFRKLPREIRDLLYEYALGNEPATTGGLGTWLLTSKSTCAEVTATFTRTRFMLRE